MKKTTCHDVMIVLSGALGLLVLFLFRRSIPVFPAAGLRDTVKIVSQPDAWIWMAPIMLLGALVGAVAALTLTRIQKRRRARLISGMACLMLGLVYATTCGIPKPLCAGFELPVILFGLLLVFWKYPRQVGTSSPNNRVENFAP